MAKLKYGNYTLPDITSVYTPEMQAQKPIAFIHTAASGSTLGEGTYLVAADRLGYITHPTDDSGAVIDNSFYLYTLGGNDLIADQADPIAFARWKVNGDMWELVEADHQSNIYAGVEVGWTNTTLKDADGDTFLEASTPVPAFNLKSFLTGFALGIAGKPLPLAPSQKEPVAFLYGHVSKDGETPTHIVNGVGYVGAVLPKLPEWDAEIYPYAMMCRLTETEIERKGYEYGLFVSDTKCGYESSVAYPGVCCPINGAGAVAWLSYRLQDDNTWSEPKVLCEDHVSIGFADIKQTKLWTNTDIVDISTNTLYLAATDPIPIYE